MKRLRPKRGRPTEDLGWLQVEKKRGKPITNELLRWFRIHKIRAKDILFIVDRMSPLQIRNYLQKQKKYFDGSCRQALITWQDYMAMAQRLHIDTSDEIIYRVRKLRQRHDELVIQCEAGSLELQAEKMAEKYPNVDGICRELQKKYTYAEEEYMVVYNNLSFVSDYARYMGLVNEACDNVNTKGIFSQEKILLIPPGPPAGRHSGPAQTGRARPGTGLGGWRPPGAGRQAANR